MVSYFNIPNLVQIFPTNPDIMGCLDIYGSSCSNLPQHRSRNYGPPMNSVWRPTIGHQILWRPKMTFWNYSSFQVCASLAWKCLFTHPNGGFGDIWVIWPSKSWEQYQWDPVKAPCWILEEVLIHLKSDVEWQLMSTHSIWLKYL